MMLKIRLINLKVKIAFYSLYYIIVNTCSICQQSAVGNDFLYYNRLRME